MARPKTPHPTPAELEVLKLLWEHGPQTVREVQDRLAVTDPTPRAYTSVMSLLNVMFDKGLLDREPEGRAFRYRATAERRPTLSGLVGDVWRRAFESSASSLVAHLLEEANPTPEELLAIREALKKFEQVDPPAEDRP